MKRQVPIFLVFLTGLIMVIQYFVPHKLSEDVLSYSNDFIIVIGILALPIGIYSLILNTWEKARHDPKERLYSLTTLFGFAIMVLSGLKRDWFNGPLLLHHRLFDNVLVPAEATLFSMLAFYIASAAYRAFRVRTWLAGILLVTAFIIMLRMIPLPGALGTANSELVRWILAVPNMAAKRSIIIGVGLGALAYSMKILLGIERSYMGRN
jgi:hypothetical protein